jgi:hypothetical protein
MKSVVKASFETKAFYTQNNLIHVTGTKRGGFGVGCEDSLVVMRNITVAETIDGKFSVGFFPLSQLHSVAFALYSSRELEH